MVSKSSQSDRALIYSYIFNNQVAFNDLFFKKSHPEYESRYYQYPALLSPEMIVYGGRSWGKSWILESRWTRSMIMEPHKESVLTSFRRAHVRDRCEGVIQAFLFTPYLSPFVRNIVRSPFYEVRLTNGHIGAGISVGDDPQAINIQGRHPSRLYVEEAQSYPRHAWQKSASTRDPKGRLDYICGVKDGRVDTPYRKMESSSKPKVTLGQVVDPNWCEETKKEVLEVFLTEDNDEYKQQVLAEWGQPSWSAWDMESIANCMSQSFDMPLIRITGEQSINSLDSLFMLLPSLDTGRTCIMGIDVGYTTLTSILIFQERGRHWELVARVELKDKVDPNRQVEIIRYLMDYCLPLVAGVDSTDGMGRSIALSLIGLGYNIQEVFFNGTITTGYRRDRQGDIELDPQGKPVEEKEEAKEFSTVRLRKGFTQRIYRLGYDENILSDFDKEFARKVGDKTRVITPDGVHIPDAFRCFEVARYFALEFQPPEEANPFVMPEVVDSGIFRDTGVY